MSLHIDYVVRAHQGVVEVAMVPQGAADDDSIEVDFLTPALARRIASALNAAAHRAERQMPRLEAVAE